MDKIVEINELIIAGPKLIVDKIDVPLRNLNWYIKKNGRKIRLEGQVKRLQKDVKLLR